MANVIGKEPCPKCRAKGLDHSGDNVIVYDDGGRFCFACNKTLQLSDTYKEKYKIEERKEIIYPMTNFTIEDWFKYKSQLNTDPKSYRGLKKAVCDQYGVYHEYNEKTGAVVRQIYPITKNHTFSGYKFRNTEVKGFGAEGTNGKECELFGQAAFADSSSKQIVIAQGELDALSAFQMLNERNNSDYDPIPVVSGTVGEKGSIKQYKNNFDFLDRFEKIIFIPDNDAVGQEALHEVAKVLPKNKLYVMELPLKDCNEMLEAQEANRFRSTYWNKTKHYSPAGIHGSDALYDMMLEKAKIPKIKFPPFLEGLNRATAGGISQGSIVNITAGSGSGKTTLINQLILGLALNNSVKVGVVSLEADGGDYCENLIGCHMQRKLQLFQTPEEKVAFLESDEARAAGKEVLTHEDGSPRFYVIDDRGDFSQLEERIEKLIITCECNFIVIDVLSDVFDGQTLEYQSKWMAWEKSINKMYGVTIVNIMHTRKLGSNQKSASRGAVLSEEDMSGSSSSYKSASMNIILSRDKTAEDEELRNMVQVMLAKNRQTGWTGVACTLFYDAQTHTLTDATERAEQLKAATIEAGIKFDPATNKYSK